MPDPLPNAALGLAGKVREFARNLTVGRPVPGDALRDLERSARLIEEACAAGLPVVSAAVRVSVEDIRPGTFLVVLGVMHFDLSDDPLLKQSPPLCVNCSDGDPVRVLSVCMPFVMVETASKEVRTIDTRTHAVARVDENYALEMFTYPGAAGCDD